MRLPDLEGRPERIPHLERVIFRRLSDAPRVSQLVTGGAVARAPESCPFGHCCSCLGPDTRPGTDSYTHRSPPSLCPKSPRTPGAARPVRVTFSKNLTF